MSKTTNSHRLSRASKEANKFAWYKERADELESIHRSQKLDDRGVDRLKRMQVYYDLYNNIIDVEDFNHVCNPYGKGIGEMPARLTNKDIVSGKIKSMLGKELDNPIAWNTVAVNPEATTRKEQEEANRMKAYLSSQILGPIQQKIEIAKQQQIAGQELDEEQLQNIKAEIEQELQAQTPEEVKKYMLREHQDPAEVLSNQLLRYLYQKNNLTTKFNLAYKHGLLSAVQCMYVGILNGEPETFVVNSKRLTYDDSPELESIEKGDYAIYEHFLTPSQIIGYFSDTITDKEIDEVYSTVNARRYYSNEDLYAISDRTDITNRNSTAIPVLHTVWKDLRKVGFLLYQDEDGQEQEKMVSEDYKLNTDFGDIEITWEYIPEVYETWKILTATPIYKNTRPIPGQHKDIDTIYESSLPYYGVVYDNMNSVPTSLMSRLAEFQYAFDIIYYRLEMLMASDKGKKVLLDVKAVQKSSGLTLPQWQYYFESTPFMWYDSSEDSAAGNDRIATVLDLSIASDIRKYVDMLEYIRTLAGQSTGITSQVEGQTSANEAVSNTRQNLTQASHILRVYFDYHTEFKKNVLTGLIETAKVAYAGSKPRKLYYFLDDMSVQNFTLDSELLDNSTYGLFTTDAGKTEDIKETLRTLTHAAMQNQKIELSDVLAVLEHDNLTEAKETLMVAETTREERLAASQEREIQANQESEKRAEDFENTKHEWAKELVILKEEEKRKTVIASSALVGMSFNPEADADRDGINDFFEIAKHGLNAEIQKGKLDLAREKFEHEKIVDADKSEISNKKLLIEKAKNQQKSATK